MLTPISQLIENYQANNPSDVKYTQKDYRNTVKSVWCPGCGDFGVLQSLANAFAMLNIPPHQLAVISGIGCSSRIPGYLNTFGFNTLHGRSVSIASGLKLASPKTHVVVCSGDGDTFAIGVSNFFHSAKRNHNILHIVMDNGVYGLTKGQASPTTPSERKTTTTHYGTFEEPTNAPVTAISFGATFVARGYAGNIKHLTEMVVRGMTHNGYSFLHVLSPCVTYVGKEEYKILNEKAIVMPEDGHDESDVEAALSMALQQDKIHLGVFYHVHKKNYQEHLDVIRQNALLDKKGDIANLLDKFKA